MNMRLLATTLTASYEAMSANAQLGTATLSGAIAESAGRAVSGARVVLRNKAQAIHPDLDQ